MPALPRLALRYKTVTILLVALLLGVGILSLVHLNRELFPSLELPAVVVTAVQPGAAPAPVAEGLAGPIEDAFRGTAGIKHVSSTSLQSVAIVAAAHEFGTDMAAAEREVRERLGAITFPTGVATPMVQRISLDSIPIVTMAVFGDDEAVTEAYVDAQLLPALQAAAGVDGGIKKGGSRQLA